MRNLQGSSDTALDQSMGRKAARLAAKPHVVGSIALDQRLRGAGGGPEGPLEFDSGSITKTVFGMTFLFTATFKGGQKPYTAVCVPNAVGFSGIDANGSTGGVGMDPAIDYLLTVTDSLGASVDLRLNVFGFANDETRPLPLPATVVGPDPVAALRLEVVSITGSVASFRATGGVEPISYNFGDGSNPVVAREATHTYAASGAFLVVITDAEGHISTEQVIIQSSDEPETEPVSFPWDTMTTHAQIDAWADANGVTRGEDWAQMTLASKRAWLVAYYDGDRPWETAN